MRDYLEAEKDDRKRRRRERYIIAVLLVVVTGLTTYLGLNVIDLGLELPLANSTLIFALINLNVILLLLLLFLTVRNLVKLLFERRKNLMGAKLRTKLVTAFVTLSLLPTLILFFVSVQFISTSIEYWFNLPIERSLRNSLEVGQGFYGRMTDDILACGNILSGIATYSGYMIPSRRAELNKFIDEKRIEHRLDSIKAFSKNLELRAISVDTAVDLSSFKNPNADAMRKSVEHGSDTHEIQSSSYGDLISGIVPIFSSQDSRGVVGLLVLEKFVPSAFVNRLNAISSGLEEYKQFKILKSPVKISHMITLAIVTLLIIFCSVWFGLYLSKGITVPIQELAEGTNRIASGDYDFFIDLESRDEIGVLVNSFNRMTLDLKNSKQQLEQANEELRKSNVELDQRRQYMEIVLANVAAGVISVDAEGRILTINKSAERMLHLEGANVFGKHYGEVIGQENLKAAGEFFQDRSLLRKGFLQRQVKVTVEDKVLSLLVFLNVLRDDRGKYLGLVAVFEDLTEVEKGHRMAAWREVARRIAHEVKNPLTPIQLSAQRLRKRYAQKLGKSDGKVFDDCTNMIINQVEELKRLVNEFSSYARMPSSNPAPNDLNRVVEESVSLYRESHKKVGIFFQESMEIPLFNFDREQMKRAMINLLDNAMDAIEGAGEIRVELSFDKEEEKARIEVSDNGNGISPEHKMRLFEPYFSTKTHGTGLGLAIVSTIINDHNGSIRVQDNHPKGTRFIIELPVKT
ncbi:MAG: HAMP domain-containing protein [Desulfobacteraceae bacterium]|nr:MAG: HAMP domain-containing protein [Desulfobacteraceae bacterium]